MEFLSNKPLLITDTILRDAHQSQAATRMTTADMLPALEMLDSIGYYSLECWGGATFDACMRFLNEDPWERLRTIRQHVKHTKLQMLFRGQNILGYKHYADDVVDAFCRKSIENGIDIIRIFDALNDVRNLEQAIKSTRKYGGEVEATMSYTVSPIHNEDYFVKLAKTLEDMGASAICVKDMANLLLPMDAYSLIKRLKETVSIPIHLHTHNTTGTGDMVNLMAAMAGVDIVDTALSPPCQRHLPARHGVSGGHAAGHRPGHRAGSVQAQRGGGPLPQGGGPSAKRGDPGSQGAAGGHQHPALSGPRRHAVQPDLPAQTGWEGGQVL